MEKLHPDTFELTMQVVLGWRMDHPNRTIYYQLVNTFRAYAPDIQKVISVLKEVIKDKKQDIVKYYADFDYIRECKECIEVNNEILELIPEISERRIGQIAEQERALKEIDEQFEKRRTEAQAYDRKNML